MLHGLNAALLWRVLRRLGVPGARLAALIFALHPVNVASVAWIAERKNTLALALYACSLLWYLRFEDAGQRRWYWLAVGAFVLAIFSKAAAVPLPAVLLGMAWWRRGRVEWRDVTRSLLFFALAAGASALAIWVQHEGSSATARTADFWLRVGEAGCAVWFYLGKALLPLNLIPVYPMWHFDEANMALYLPGLCVLAVIAAGWRYRRQWGRVILGGFGYFVLLLMPVLGFVNISMMRYTLVADQWQYFAIIGPIALVAGGVTWAMRHAGKEIAFPTAACCALLVTLGVLTWKQSSLYANPATLWQATVQANPESFLAHSSLGSLLFRSGKTAEAEAEYETALKIEPNFDDAHYDLGNIYLQTGRPAKAIAEYRRVVEIRPNFVLAYNNMAWVLATCPQASLRNGAEAVEYAKRANQLSRGRNPSIMATLGAAYAESGQFAEAISTAQEALRIAVRQHDEVGIKELGRQLDFYQKGTPYRDPPTAGEAGKAVR
jgi:tetratricopeptide (TPR) repeat protein